MIKDNNELTNYNLINLCRMTRAWRNKWNVPMGGLLIDTLANQFLINWQYKDKSYLYYDWMARDFFYICLVKFRNNYTGKLLVVVSIFIEKGVLKIKQKNATTLLWMQLNVNPKNTILLLIKLGEKFMVQPTQTNQTSNANTDSLKILESQIRECFGRVVFTHKTHEKSSDIYAEQLKKLKLLEIILSALTTTSLLSSVFGEQKIGTIIGAILSTIILGITIYTKDYDLGQIAKSHADAANKLWNIRELYISLIADIKANNLTIDQIKARRDVLQESLNLIYQNAPRTNYQAYERASQAINENGQLNTGEEMTFSDKEIDRFLPHDLRRIT
jgi:hypothetical protein